MRIDPHSDESEEGEDEEPLEEEESRYLHLTGDCLSLHETWFKGNHECEEQKTRKRPYCNIPAGVVADCWERE